MKSLRAPSSKKASRSVVPTSSTSSSTSTSSSSSSNSRPHFSIAVRLRPEHSEERLNKQHRICVKPVDDKLLIFDPVDTVGGGGPRGNSVIPDNYNKAKNKSFAFDNVFDQFATQREVYEKTTQNLITSVMNGYNATVYSICLISSTLHTSLRSHLTPSYFIQFTLCYTLVRENIAT